MNVLRVIAIDICMMYKDNIYVAFIFHFKRLELASRLLRAES